MKKDAGFSYFVTKILHNTRRTVYYNYHINTNCSVSQGNMAQCGNFNNLLSMFSIRKKFRENKEIRYFDNYTVTI